MNAQLVINGGSSADPADKPGLATMTAGLVTQGAGGRTAPEIASTLEALGANIGGGAGRGRDHPVRLRPHRPRRRRSGRSWPMW